MNSDQPLADLAALGAVEPVPAPLRPLSPEVLCELVSVAEAEPDDDPASPLLVSPFESSALVDVAVSLSPRLPALEVAARLSVL